MAETKKNVFRNRTTNGNYYFHKDEHNKYLTHFNFKTPKYEYQQTRQTEVLIEKLLLTTKCLELIGEGTATFDKLLEYYKNSPPRAFEVYKYCYFKIFDFTKSLGNECYETRTIKTGNKPLSFITNNLIADIKNDKVDIPLLIQAIGKVYNGLNAFVNQDENN